MRKDELSLLDGFVDLREEGRQQEHHQRAQPGISSVVWGRLVKGEGITGQPWHHRLQFIRFNE